LKLTPQVIISGKTSKSHFYFSVYVKSCALVKMVVYFLIYILRLNGALLIVSLWGALFWDQGFVFAHGGAVENANLACFSIP